MYLFDVDVLRVLVSMMPGRGKGGAHKVRHLKAKQQKKKFIRSKDPILSVFMWGVQHSVSKLDCGVQRRLARTWDGLCA